MPHMHGRNTQESSHLTTLAVFITLLSLLHYARRHKRMPLLHVIKHVAHKSISVSCNSCLKMPMHSRECGWPAHSTVSYTCDDGGRKHIDPIKNTSICTWPYFQRSPFVKRFIYNMLRVRFMHSSNHTEHYRK